MNEAKTVQVNPFPVNIIPGRFWAVSSEVTQPAAPFTLPLKFFAGFTSW